MFALISSLHGLWGLRGGCAGVQVGAAPAVGVRASTRLGRRLEVRAAAKLGLLGWELEAGALQRLLQRGAVGLTASCGAQVPPPPPPSPRHTDTLWLFLTSPCALPSASGVLSTTMVLPFLQLCPMSVSIVTVRSLPHAVFR